MTAYNFESRHIGPRRADLTDMLAALGVDSLDQLIDETVPSAIRLKQGLDLPPALSEHQYADCIHKLAAKNEVYKSYVGLGYHPTVLPGVIQRNILENPGWYTAYTPYQAEVAQGRLEALLNFQTTVSDLTALPLANASLLDEPTAAAEAMCMLFRARSRMQEKNGAVRFFVSREVLPQTIDLLRTRALPVGIELVVDDHEEVSLSESFFGALLQYPAKFGAIYRYEAFSKTCAEKGIKIAVAADILSLTLLRPPGEWGAAVVVGTSQRFGIPMGYGGPHAGFFATLEAYKRFIPGRIIGVTKDAAGNPALRMALQTREQHIKRERATSNICTSQVLSAVMAGMYAVYHGAAGLRQIAHRIHQLTATLARGAEGLGYRLVADCFFDTVQLEGADAKAVRRVAESHRLNFFYIDDDSLGISLNETTTLKDVDEILEVLAQAMKKPQAVHFDSPLAESFIPIALIRRSAFLTQAVFHLYRSETELMRYIKKLERKDLSLNHAMIPLGSCTMKLNAAAEMLPLGSRAWCDLHPFAPAYQTEGYREVFRQLKSALHVITGLAATSLQPNSGAQGEFAGLMVIRAYHSHQGDAQRDVVLIPESAHGTNPASAVMAGMKVAVIRTDPRGGIDLEDLRAHAEKYKDRLAALMITYPATHGVFETSIREVTKVVHDHGGQVYMDGANMNAQVGLTNPAAIGADVCHLNLHKTFAIPHGGGGPGMGPICVAAHLAPFLPSNPIVPTGGQRAISAISGAPFGSAWVLLISYGYIKMLGSAGLTNATKYAILNANYLKTRLEKDFKILYTGAQGRVAHEFILDCRPFKQKGVTVTDIAKRLMDYGFHAPTVSFPVPGTLMIEPTESEGKAELDRFADAMLSILSEIDGLAAGDGNDVLHNAPHTLDWVTAEEWHLPYSRQRAAFPLPYLREHKFWPSVRRVDDAYGDRNLVCSCPAIEAHMQAVKPPDLKVETGKRP